MSFLDELIDDAAALAESQLPSQEEMRGVIAALANRVKQLEEHFFGDAGAPKPDLAAQAREQARAAAQAELAAAQARLAELDDQTPAG